LYKKFRIGKHEVFPGAVPLLLPDIGTFFNQDMNLATEMIYALGDLGLPVIKGEILHTPEICLPDSGDEVFWGHVSGKEKREHYRSLIERKVLPLSSYEKLFRRCFELGMDVVVSVYDFEGARFAKDIGVAALKIASSNITHQPLIEYVAGLGLPVIIDTGHSTLEEIARAVDWARDAGQESLIVEHSPLAPPNEVGQQNLRFMSTLGNTFAVPFGLSDHHDGDEMLYAAAALGASVIEKGVRPEGLGDEQDAAHALSINQVKVVYSKIQNIHAAMGSGVRTLRRNREKYRSRMGLIARRDLNVGDRISLDTVSFAFPARGIMVEHWREVVGWSLTTPIRAGEAVGWQDIRELPR
jgi:sialic acid synthase SpsE